MLKLLTLSTDLSAFPFIFLALLCTSGTFSQGLVCLGLSHPQLCGGLVLSSDILCSELHKPGNNTIILVFISVCMVYFLV